MGRGPVLWRLVDRLAGDTLQDLQYQPIVSLVGFQENRGGLPILCMIDDSDEMILADMQQSKQRQGAQDHAESHHIGYPPVRLLAIAEAGDLVRFDVKHGLTVREAQCNFIAAYLERGVVV